MRDFALFLHCKKKGSTLLIFVLGDKIYTQIKVIYKRELHSVREGNLKAINLSSIWKSIALRTIHSFSSKSYKMDFPKPPDDIRNYYVLHF